MTSKKRFVFVENYKQSLILGLKLKYLKMGEAVIWILSLFFFYNLSEVYEASICHQKFLCSILPITEEYGTTN